jgi:uncharacterized protein (TIGR02268 family)
VPPRPRGVLLTLACLWGMSAMAQPATPREDERDELARPQEENQRPRAELARPSEAPAPVSLIQLRNEGRLGEAGVATRNIRSDIQWAQGGGLWMWAALSHRIRGRAAVELVLDNGGPREPWSVDEATLVGPGGEALQVLSVWMAGPLVPGNRGRVMVEVAGEPGPGNHTLRLWKRDGGSVLILETVKFPKPVRPRPGGRP